MTEKLYDIFPYETEFEATVLQAETQDGRLLLVLDRTLFFPNEGGQSCDKGWIAGHAVQDVNLCDDLVYHSLAADAPLRPGMQIHGKIDWAHRFSNMQQHSAEHLFSGFVHKRYGFANCGFHLSDSIATMDFDGPLSAAQIAETELSVNEAIYANVPSRAFFPSPEEAKTLSYRSKKEIEGPLRLLSFEGYDLCACCAPHVGRTGEIGLFKVQSFQRYKGGVRISYLAGKRAFLAARQQFDLLNRLCRDFSANAETLEGFVLKLREELSAAKSKALSVQEKLLRYELERCGESVLFLPDVDMNTARELITSHTKETGRNLFCFIPNDKGYRYIISTAVSDARQAQTLLQTRLHAKGGGSDRLIMGTVEAAMEEIQDVCTILSQTL